MAINQGFDAGDDPAANRTERRTPANGENVPNEETTLAAPGISTYFVDEKIIIPDVDKVSNFLCCPRTPKIWYMTNHHRSRS